MMFIIAIVLYLGAAFYFYRFWNSFRKIPASDTASNEVSVISRKRIKVALFLFSMGVVANIMTIFMKTL